MKHKTVKICGRTKNMNLASACGSQSFVYSIEVEKGEASSKKNTVKMNFLKNKFDGTLVQKEPIDTSQGHLNIYHFDSCTLAYSN